MPASAAHSTEPSEWVVLLHGLFATHRSMRLLESRIQIAGYRVLNWSYPTWWRPTREHVRCLLPKLEQLQYDPSIRTIHFVTHSMGGIVARSLLHFGSDAKVKRLVMLAPPNHGSHLTRLPLQPIQWCLPAIADLRESPDSLPNRLVTSAHIEIGVIAASRDFVVPIASTQLANQRDHCVLDTSHFKLPTHELAIRYSLNFLRSGRFLSQANVREATHEQCRAA